MSHEMNPVTVFSTTSDIEASVVLALLDSHGISGFRISGNPQAILPMSMSPLGEVRIAVPEDLAEEALRIIDSHREDVGARVVRLRDEFDEIETRIGYRFKDRGLLEHALTHKSRAAEDVSGGVADNESLEFLGDAVLGLVVASALFHQYPTYNEGQKSKIKASVVSTQALARQAEEMGLGDHLILGTRRREDGRPLQAGAARGRIRSAHRRHLSGWRYRSGRGVPPARIERCHRRRCGAELRGPGLQVRAAGARAGAGTPTTGISNRG